MSGFAPEPSIDRIKSANPRNHAQTGLELLFVQSHIEILAINSFDGAIIRARRSVPGVPDVTSILINDSNENLFIVSEKKELSSSHPLVGIYDLDGRPVMELVSNGSEANSCFCAGLGFCRCCTMDFTVTAQDKAIGHFKQKFAYKKQKYEIVDESMNITHSIESNKYQDHSGMHQNPWFSVYDESNSVVSQIKKMGPRFVLKLNSNMDIKLKGILICFFLHVNNTYLHNTAGKDRMVARSTTEQPLLGKNSREKTLNLLYTASQRQATTVEPTKLDDKVDEEEEEVKSNSGPKENENKNSIENESKRYQIRPRKQPEQNDMPHPAHTNREVEDYNQDSDETNEPNRFNKQPIAQSGRQNSSDNEDQMREQRYPKFEKPGGQVHNNNAYLNSDSD